MPPSSASRLIDRWLSFVAKVGVRVTGLLAEAEVAFDDVIAGDVTNGSALAIAGSALEARILGVQKRIADSWEETEQALEDLVDAADPGAERLGLREALEREAERARDLAFEVELACQSLLARKQGLAARRLGELSGREMTSPRSCAACGQPLAAEARHLPTNATCAACGCVTMVPIGPATAAFFQGGALVHLGHEVALPEWLLLRREERRFRDLRRPSASDLQRLERHTVAYWRRHLETIAAHHPDWDEHTVEAQLRAKLGHFRLVTRL